MGIRADYPSSFLTRVQFKLYSVYLLAGYSAVCQPFALEAGGNNYYWELSVMVHACNFSTQGAEADRSGILSLPGLQSKFQVNLGKSMSQNK